MSEKGQILPGSNFGKVLTELAREAENIVEIGSWYGQGSTKCLANGLIRPSQRMWTIEQDPTVHAEAKSYYDDPRITFIRGHTMDVLDKLPKEIDLILFDGDDISTDLEFDFLAPRTEVIALDDTRQRKNFKQRKSLKESIGWHIEHDVLNERHGWLTARRLNEYDQIYLKGGWDGLGSGPGSTFEFTEGFRQKVEALSCDVKSVLDYGCGDWSWQRYVGWGCEYIGWDKSSIAIKLAIAHAGPINDFDFHVGDPFVQTGRLEITDLLIVKDVMHHVDFGEAMRIVEMAKRFPMVLWVMDMDSDHRPCFWPTNDPPEGEVFHQFDTSIQNYRYGPKTAFLQRNK